jgi:hypothetical protein
MRLAQARVSDRMAKGNGNGKGNGRGVGRPSAYRPEYDAQAYQFCLLGATDHNLASAFGVTEQTINNWKHAHPSFLESLTRGKDIADGRVAESLYRRATGWEHDAVKITYDAKTRGHAVFDYVEKYPPDTTAAIFWLKNRQPALWRDKVTLDGEVGVYRAVDRVPQHEIGRLLALPDDQLRTALAEYGDE